jgi:methyl-accepting chemotaxis protein
MTAEAVGGGRRDRRSKLLVDPMTQLGAVFGVVGIAASFILVWIAARVFGGGAAAEELSSDAASRLAALAEALFVAIGVAVIAIYVIWLTHRFAGPARVLRDALARMAEGDFGGRLKLRPRDFMKDVAVEVARVGRSIRDDRRAALSAVDSAERALAAGDATTARAILKEFRELHGEWVDAADGECVVAVESASK